MKNKKEIETIKFTYDEYEICQKGKNETEHDCTECYEKWKYNYYNHDFKERGINKGIMWEYDTISELVLDISEDTSLVTDFVKWVELETEYNNPQWHDTTLEYKNGEFWETSSYIDKKDKKILTLTEEELDITKELMSVDWGITELDEVINDLKEMKFTEPFKVFYALNLLFNGTPNEFINGKAIDKLLLEQIKEAAAKQNEITNNIKTNVTTKQIKKAMVALDSPTGEFKLVIKEVEKINDERYGINAHVIVMKNFKVELPYIYTRNVEETIKEITQAIINKWDHKGNKWLHCKKTEGKNK